MQWTRVVSTNTGAPRRQSKQHRFTYMRLQNPMRPYQRAHQNVRRWICDTSLVKCSKLDQCATFEMCEPQICMRKAKEAEATAALLSLQANWGPMRLFQYSSFLPISNKGWPECGQIFRNSIILNKDRIICTSLKKVPRSSSIGFVSHKKLFRKKLKNETQIKTMWNFDMSKVKKKFLCSVYLLLYSFQY